MSRLVSGVVAGLIAGVVFGEQMIFFQSFAILLDERANDVRAVADRVRRRVLLCIDATNPLVVDEEDVVQDPCSRIRSSGGATSSSCSVFTSAPCAPILVSDHTMAATRRSRRWCSHAVHWRRPASHVRITSQVLGSRWLCLLRAYFSTCGDFVRAARGDFVARP